MGKFFATIIMLIAATFFIIGCEKSPTQPEPFQSDSDWVDLGLPSGLLWATHNVGATSPEDYGDYFAWGETAPKSVYDMSTYRYGIESGYTGNIFTKYCSVSYYGYNSFTDNLTILQPGDDAATANYGGRTPTYDEWHELIDHTTAQWTTQNDVNGCRFTGSNGNSIFLPAVGYIDGTDSICVRYFATYWSSSLDTDIPMFAWRLYFDNGNRQYLGGGSRSEGCAVRAVRQN